MSKSGNETTYSEAMQRVMTRAAVSIDDAAIVLGVSRNSAFKAAVAGQIDVVAIGRLKKVPTALLRDRLGIKAEPAQVAA